MHTFYLTKSNGEEIPLTCEDVPDGCEFRFVSPDINALPFEAREKFIIREVTNPPIPFLRYAYFIKKKPITDDSSRKSN